MSGLTPLVPAPFAHQGGGVTRLMVLVMVALTPATGYGLYLFGWPAIFLFLVTVLSAVVFEALSLVVGGRRVGPFLGDGSAVLTGWILALTLPPWAPWWIGVVGAFIAVVIGKQVFGGLGQNLFNPAMVARVALLISFPLEMTRWMQPLPIGTPGAPGILDGLAITFGGGSGIDLDALSGASALGHVKTELDRGLALPDILPSVASWEALGLGQVPGSLGETSAALLLIGGLFLLATRVIRWQIPVAMLGSLALAATLTHLIDPARYPDAVFHLLGGSAMLGAFFIATDYVTSPVTARGQLIFGAGCGVLVFVIRTWAGYPEGVAFAVLLMNAMVPLIDRWVRPRVFGRTATGKPLSYPSSKEPSDG